MKQMDDITMILLKYVITICAVLITAYVLPYIKTLKDDARYAKVIEVVELAVRAAEQVIRDPKSGNIKKARVLKVVRKWLGEHNIDISEDEIDQIIESAVYAMKQGKES